MCLHASWMTPETCTRCNPPRTGFKVHTLGLEKAQTKVKRVSTLPSTFIPRKSGDPVKPLHACVGCGQEVNPGFCYKGSVLSDLQHSTLLTSSTTPVLGVIRIESPGVMKDVVIGGHTIDGTKRISYRKRTKGLLCTGCAANYTRVSDGKGGTVPIVETDPLGGYLGETARGAEMEFKPLKKGPAFNTRYTQGRRGKRV